MFTNVYKTCFIHGYCGREQCRVQLPDCTILGTFRSYRAAQRAITKWLKQR